MEAGSTRAFIAKVIGAVAAIAIAVGSFTAPPLLTIDKALAGMLLAGGLLALGVNIGATVAAGREAAVLRAKRRSGSTRRD